jgi:hypothetical protein
MMIEEKVLVAKRRHSDRSWLILSCCLALGLIFSLFLLKHDNFIETDGCSYALSGKNLVSGKGYTVWGRPSLWFPPSYPLAIGIFYKFMGNLELAGHTVSLISFLISIIFLFKLARLVYNKSVAFLTVILFIMNKSVLEHSYQVWTHSLDMLLVTIIIYLASLIIKSEKLKNRNFILLGIILAAAILNRPENIILSSAIILILFIQKKEQIFRKIAAFFYLIIVLAILVLPYANFLHKHTGKWTLTTKITLLQFCEYVSYQDPFAYEKQIIPNFSEFKPFEYIMKNKRELSGRYLKGIRLFPLKLKRVLYGVFGCILIGLGLFWQAWDKDKKRIQILLLFALSPLAILPLSDMKDRLFTFAIPIFLIWMAKGLENLSLPIKKYLNFTNRESMLAIYFVLTLLVSPIASFLAIKGNITPPLEHKQMGLWMKNNIKDIENKKIASRKPWVAFYSGAQHTGISFKEDYNSLPGHLMQRGVDYLIIDEELIPIKRPQLKLFLDDQKKHDGLIKEYVIRKPKKIILYQLE